MGDFAYHSTCAIVTLHAEVLIQRADMGAALEQVERTCYRA